MVGALSPAPARRHILWVEADRSRAARLRAQLPPDYALSVAASGTRALALLAQHPYWLVTLTDGLADVPVLALLSQVRRLAPSALVMLCSEAGDFRLAGQALECGAHALLPGSWDREELLRRLRWLEQRPPPTPLVASAHDGDRLQRVEGYVSSHIDRPIRQKDLLEVACLSRSALHRYLKRTTGMSYSQYISSRRVQRAKQLLANEDIPIYRVATESGFQDSAYFSRWFKQATAVSPLAYRNALRGAKGQLAIGALVPLSGAYGDLGQDVLTGIEFAAAEIAARFGMQITVHPIDTETCPRRAAEKVLDAAGRLGIRHFTGCISSAVVVEVARAVEATASLLVTSACAGLTGTGHSGHVFRWSLPVPKTVRKAAVPVLRSDPRAARWFTITADYAFGHALLTGTAEVCRQYDIHHVGNVFHEIGHRDFRPLFRQARAARAQTIVLLNFGDDTHTALRQAREMGITEGARLLVVWSNGAQSIRRIGVACAEGVLFGTQYWEKADLPANNLLRREWRRQFESEPTYLNVTGYIGTQMLHMAFRKTGSADPEANRAALAGLEWEGLTSIREYVNADTHWTEKGYFLLQADPSGAVAELAV